MTDTLRRDLSFATRSFARNPGFTVTVILTLALAIGANTAIFSLVNALLIKNAPLPPSRTPRHHLHPYRPPANTPATAKWTSTAKNWELLRDDVPALIPAISSGITSGVNLQAQSLPVQSLPAQTQPLPAPSSAANTTANSAAGQIVQYLHAARVSAHYFDVLAIPPLLGRAFSESEDRPHGPRVAMLSYSLWHTTFHADPAILGRPITLKGEPYSVIGVLPDRPTPLDADIYTALQPSRDGEGGGDNYEPDRPPPRRRHLAAGQRRTQPRLGPHRRSHLRSSPSTNASFHLVPLQQSADSPNSALRSSSSSSPPASSSSSPAPTSPDSPSSAPSAAPPNSPPASPSAPPADKSSASCGSKTSSSPSPAASSPSPSATSPSAASSLSCPEHFLPVASVPSGPPRPRRHPAHCPRHQHPLRHAPRPRHPQDRPPLLHRHSRRLQPRQPAPPPGPHRRRSRPHRRPPRRFRPPDPHPHPPRNPPSRLQPPRRPLRQSLPRRRPLSRPRRLPATLTASTAAMRQIPGVQTAAVGLSLPYERPLNDQRHRSTTAPTPAKTIRLRRHLRHPRLLRYPPDPPPRRPHLL